MAFHNALLVLGLFNDRSVGAILLGARFVERLETASCAGASVWSFPPATNADELCLILDAE